LEQSIPFPQASTIPYTYKGEGHTYAQGEEERGKFPVCTNSVSVHMNYF